jgi:hypothetical protein
MTTQKKIIIAVLVIALAVIMYFVFFRKPAKKVDAVFSEPKPDGRVIILDNNNFPLNVGSRGENVKSLQTALNFIEPANKLTLDGVFGPQTRIKLLRTVHSSLAVLPMSKSNLNSIIKLGNDAVIARNAKL